MGATGLVVALVDAVNNFVRYARSCNQLQDLCTIVGQDPHILLSSHPSSLSPTVLWTACDDTWRSHHLQISSQDSRLSWFVEFYWWTNLIMQAPGYHPQRHSAWLRINNFVDLWKIWSSFHFRSGDSSPRSRSVPRSLQQSHCSYNESCGFFFIAFTTSRI